MIDSMGPGEYIFCLINLLFVQRNFQLLPFQNVAHCIIFRLVHLKLTLMLLVTNLTKTKDVKKLKDYLNPGKTVLIWECSARAIKWIPTWHGLDGFKRSMYACPLDKSSLSIRRVKICMAYLCLYTDFISVYS